ncbi:hypothetical protein FACS189487_06120 [Campylobacterota bacterium]|nr:hypothetical protein FACS189487_06120 [Campylobacterota bacterium]
MQIKPYGLLASEWQRGRTIAVIAPKDGLRFFVASLPQNDKVCEIAGRSPQ